METIKLKYPIDVAGEKITSLNLRRPKVRDMLAADKATGSDAEKEVHLFANLCEVSPDAIMELDGADYRQLQDTYSDFLS
jgi:hypothetical protein